MNTGLEGKTVLVAESVTNFGRTTAVAFAKEGANLVLASRTPDEIDGVCEEANSLGVQCIARRWGCHSTWNAHP